MARLNWRRALPTSLVGFALVVGVACQPKLPPPGDTSTLVGCDQAGQRVQITASSHLDPSCTYTKGFDITASDVTFDCQGATIASTGGGAGILISSPVDQAMDSVTVRNCDVEGFLNSLKVTRPGFRFLPDDEEFEHPLSNILIERSRFADSRGVGVYVDGYVTGVTIRNNRVVRAGSSGIYLETGSNGSLVESNAIYSNGYIENGPNGKAIDFNGVALWFWGVGREGISIDGSYDNTVRNNTFADNSAGGIFLYKNCGEYPDSNPDRYFERRDPSDDNLIEGNLFLGGRHGVWVGSRMGENTYPMECSDPAYVEHGVTRVVHDYAKNNTIRDNEFRDVTYGIRVEDDANTVTGNLFSADSPDHHAVIVGTPYRTDVLGLPVADTVLSDNVSTIVGNADPYRWVHGTVGTAESGNLALGAPSALCEGEPPQRQIFVMTIAVAAALPDGSKPPTPDITVPTLGALPPCAAPGGVEADTAAPGEVEQPPTGPVSFAAASTDGAG